MKRIHVILLLATMLSLSAHATDEAVSDTIEHGSPSDSIAVIIDEAVQDTVVADTIRVKVLGVPSAADFRGSLRCIQIGPNHYRKYQGPDFKFFENTTNPAAKPYTFMQDQTWVGLPIFVAGMLAKSEKRGFIQDYNNGNTRIRLVKYDFHSEVDNFTQFTGIALTAGLKMAGVEGRSSWPRLAASSLASYAVMAALVNGIKYTASEERPDLTTRNSWPSGHTATAFVGATILHKEYGMTRSPWYSVAGYGIATATGVMRVLNNRHWVSDVLSGAGIGILSTELAYGICDLLFKNKGLLMNDLFYYPDLSKNPSFFSISMGIGLGNKNLTLPTFHFETDLFDPNEIEATEGPLKLQFRVATAVGVEGAWFFNPYVGIGGRLRVKTTPIKGWNLFKESANSYIREYIDDNPVIQNAVDYVYVDTESNHLTEFAADAGVYFSLPLSSRLALGTKLLVGSSIMDDIEVSATFYGTRVILNPDYRTSEDAPMFINTDLDVIGKCDYANVHASNSMKFGTGLSLTWAYKNSFSWRLFCDYDYTTKTYTASYHPFAFLEEFAPDLVEKMREIGFDITQTMISSAHKHLHQWVLGCALCVSF